MAPGRCGTSSIVRASRRPGAPWGGRCGNSGCAGCAAAATSAHHAFRSVAGPAEYLVNRDFAPPAPDRLRVAGFTFVATRAGTAYTAFVIDAVARLIAGWRTAASHSTDLVLDALVMAVTYRARQGVKVAGLTHHSDAGSEYLSSATAPSWPPRGSRRRSGPSGIRTTTRWRRASSGCTKPRSPATWGHAETPARVEAATSEWAKLVQHRAGDAAHRRLPACRARAGLAGRDARPGPRPRPGQQAPPAHQKEAAMAAAHYPGGLRPHPPGLRPGPRPSSEMARQAGTGTAAGGDLLAGPRDGCHGTPAQVKGASGVAGDDAARHPCPARGTRGAQRVPDEEMPKPRRAAWPGGALPNQAGQLDSAAGQMFDKTKAEK